MRALAIGLFGQITKALFGSVQALDSRHCKSVNTVPYVKIVSVGSTDFNTQAQIT